MKKTVQNRTKLVITKVIASALAGAILLFIWLYPNKETSAMTVTFIEKHMKNDNSTLATYLKEASSEHPDTVAGREALSESIGLWMQYTVLSGDQDKFDESVTLLETYYLSPQKYIHWKLHPNGQPAASTNALGDDLRIIDALLKAFTRWGQDHYLNLAQEIGSTLQTSVQKNGYFVDFHDFKRDESTDVLSLVYVDISALQAMRSYGIISEQDYKKYEDLLISIPNDGTFYPKTYQVSTNQYGYDTSVNMIDQLIVGIHLAEMNHPPKQLIEFMKEQFRKNMQLMGRYNRETRKPDVAYESPAVYGLAIILALKCDDTAWAKQLNNRMIQFRSQDTAYPGGYVFNGNTHIFDNLFPLLAEKSLENKKKEIRKKK
ncbi:glycosyl hydrolase [Paenibacillus sp. N3/727]|uniref:glycosyl hydrolase n=1 Tax=Paenibacillus sp. N3/727 TaxID=2925845 RepID=UPI001F52D1D6|nr:glycosyl hydrolase [Paenibacillus sp. N3/727]UNK18308.1 glycosyl hydrolase [Paenibacillus sp. N3/727]